MSAVNLQEVHDLYVPYAFPESKTEQRQLISTFFCSLVQIAHKAGEMVTSAKPAAAGHGTKKNSADLVTETDQAVEKMVSTELKGKFPDFE